MLKALGCLVQHVALPGKEEVNQSNTASDPACEEQMDGMKEPGSLQ